MADFEKDDDGRFVTDGLDAKAFHRVFNQIQKLQRKKRTKARKTLTPSVMGRKNKELTAFLDLGKKKDGTYFTPEDIASFTKQRKAHKTAFSSSLAGITYAQLVAQSTSIDIKRANNKVTDGTGIKSATFIGLKHNLGIFSVKASEESTHSHHRVKVRFEQWDDSVESIGEEDANKDKIAANLCAGRLSFDCDCGRHQYWYRYMATAGNYCVAPPKEYSFPKIRNPDLTGVACKHVIHVVTRLQSKVWQKGIVVGLTKAAGNTSFGDDKRKTTDFFKGDMAKALSRNRQSTTNQDKARLEFAKYRSAQDAIGKKISKRDTSTERVRQLLKKARTTNQRNATARKIADEKAAKAKAQLADLKKTMIAQRDNLIKYFMSQGMSKEAATTQAKAILQAQLTNAKK